MSEPVPKLFQPATVGELTVAHRVVLAPLTRVRANKQHIHGDLAVQYYGQRASVPGTLLIAEATFIAAQAGGLSLGQQIPGIWSEEQVAGWKRVVEEVHAKGSFIYLQLWALGRAAVPEELRRENPDFPYVGASAIPLKDYKETPRPLTIPEIKEYVQWYARAASNAVNGAGFDGVEIHGANGYLVDQFLQDVTNQRTDEYGGSIENRSRFALEVVDAVVNAVGVKKTAIRLSPWSEFQGLVTKLRELHPDLAYIHVVEAGVLGFIDVD